MPAASMILGGIIDLSLTGLRVLRASPSVPATTCQDLFVRAAIEPDAAAVCAYMGRDPKVPFL